MRISATELVELAKAYLAITLAFGILLWQGYHSNFASALLISGLTVGVGFILHEMSHKYLAQKYGAWAEFRANNLFLVLAIAMSFFGFVFAAPGAVYIRGYITREKNGKISAAGIAANLVAAAGFMVLFFTTNGLARSIGQYGMMINSWLALFNLIPFGNFDGTKVLAWDKRAYATLVVLVMLMQIPSLL